MLRLSTCNICPFRVFVFFLVSACQRRPTGHVMMAAVVVVVVVVVVGGGGGGGE